MKKSNYVTKAKLLEGIEQVEQIVQVDIIDYIVHIALNRGKGIVQHKTSGTNRGGSSIKTHTTASRNGKYRTKRTSQTKSDDRLIAHIEVRTHLKQAQLM